MSFITYHRQHDEQSSLAVPVTNTWPTRLSPRSYYINAPALACSSKIFFPICVVISLDSFYCSTDICYSQLFCTFITFMTCHSAFSNLSCENRYWHLYTVFLSCILSMKHKKNQTSYRILSRFVGFFQEDAIFCSSIPMKHLKSIA